MKPFGVLGKIFLLIVTLGHAAVNACVAVAVSLSLSAVCRQNVRLAVACAPPTTRRPPARTTAASQRATLRLSPRPASVSSQILSLTSSSSSSSSLCHFYVGSIWDDSRLHAARSYTSSPDSLFSLRSSFTQSAHLFFGLPLFLLPCTSMPIILFPRYSSSLLITWPYHCILRSWTVFEIYPTFVLPLIFSFLILSNLVTPHIHRNIFISATSIFFSCAFFTARASAPYTIAGLTIVLYTFPLILTFILLSHSTPDTCFRFLHPLWTLWLTSASSSPSSASVDPRYLNVFTLFTSSPSSRITRSYCSLLLQHSVFFLLIFSPRSSIAFLHSSSFLSTSYLLVLHSTMPSANSMHHGGYNSITDISTALVLYVLITK